MFNQFMVRDFDMHVRRFFVIPDGFGAVVTVVNFSENQLSVFDPAMLIKPFILKQRLAYRNIIGHEKLDNESGWDRVLTANVKKKWVELSNTIELGERLKTFRTGLKVLTTYFQMLHGYHRP